MKHFFLYLSLSLALGCAKENSKSESPDSGLNSMKNFEYFAPNGVYSYKAKIDLTNENTVFLTLYQGYRDTSYIHFKDYSAACDESLKCGEGTYAITISKNGDVFHLRDSNFGFDLIFRKQ